jgi:hypothetical protein
MNSASADFSANSIFPSAFSDYAQEKFRTPKILADLALDFSFK